MVLVMLKMELQSMYFADLTERLGEDMKIYSTYINITPILFQNQKMHYTGKDQA